MVANPPFQEFQETMGTYIGPNFNDVREMNLLYQCNNGIRMLLSPNYKPTLLSNYILLFVPTSVDNANQPHFLYSKFP
jgi:hypothetical protein